jgi:hypothetical protein
MTRIISMTVHNLIRDGSIVSSDIAERLGVRHGIVLTWVSIVRERGVEGIRVETVGGRRDAHLTPLALAEVLVLGRSVRSPLDDLWTPLSNLLHETLSCVSCTDVVPVSGMVPDVVDHLDPCIRMLRDVAQSPSRPLMVVR